MSPFGRLRRRFGRDTKGAALTEFGLIIVPLMVVLLGAFDLGYESYARSVLQGAVNQTARMAMVEDPQFEAEGSTLEERIQNRIKDRMDGIDGPNPEYTFEQTSYYDFTSVGNAERLITDVNGNGAYDDGDCWQDYNENGTYDTDAGQTGRGDADDVIYYRVTLERPRIVPVMTLIGVPDHYRLTAQAAFRTQPYEDRDPPPTVCTASGGSSTTSSSSSSSSSSGGSGDGSTSTGGDGDGSTSTGGDGDGSTSTGGDGDGSTSTGGDGGGSTSTSTSSGGSTSGGGSFWDWFCSRYPWFC